MSELLFPGRATLGRRWHSTTFRWLSIYAVIFALSMMAMLAATGWAVTGDLARQTDAVMRWQLTYFDSVADTDLASTIVRRIEHERMHTNYYGLFSPTGKRVAGDVLQLPSQLKTDRVGETLDLALYVPGNEPAPVVRAMAVRRPDGATLVVARELTHILHIRQTIIETVIVGGLLCLAVGVATGIALSMRQMRRLNGIRRVTLLIAQGDLAQRLPVGGRDEVDMLAHLVNHMLAEVERLMSEVKGACDGIAHDLRTPLAHICTLLAHIDECIAPLDDDALSGLVERVRNETDALLDRFRAMLRISEIGALHRRGGFAEIRLDALLEDIGELYEPLAESRKIRFEMITPPVPPIHADRALLFEAISNIADNAIKFTPQGGAVRLELTRTRRGPQVEIVDNGPGIAAAEREAVMQRFYRSDRTRHVAGSGLGLSIVSAVMHVHDFSVRIGGGGSDSREPATGQCGARVTIECWPRTLH
ncbi:HAMP domain-containing sensor histidine kinase [Paraburkholderia sp.]|uniref:sensor histidine kinase n=1 Tax=Paraburkholderia sp. TaxID=1926495 RepID=UPI002396B635|nr:HAMP domain-containing sensor histidine kinase [Paraburkholderia sp.]MDE1182470.1 HAMP domain-containing sensor histidine kinase [Paraburkholderia sp.]